jgi:hypothetical protein
MGGTIGAEPSGGGRSNPTLTDNDEKRSIGSKGQAQGTKPGGLYGFIFSSTGSVTKIECLSTRHCIDQLLEQNLYETAIEFAQDERCELRQIMGLFKEYGDFLFTRGDVSTAVSVYRKTIGHLQPSYVINKLIDTVHVTELIAYLQDVQRAEQGGVQKHHRLTLTLT